MAKEEVKTEKSGRTIGELVVKIEAMQIQERKAFCKTLSLEERKQYVKYLHDRDAEEVEVVFRCFEPMGGGIKFTAYPYSDVGGTYELVDNQKISLPLCLVKRFNNEWQGIGTFYPTHAYIMDQYGKPIVGVGKKNYRFGANSPSLS